MFNNIVAKVGHKSQMIHKSCVWLPPSQIYANFKMINASCTSYCVWCFALQFLK